MVIREFVDEHNRKALEWLHQDYDHLGRQLRRHGVDIERLTARAMAFRVAVPSWGVGTGGTHFARFAGPGEPRNVFEKLDDCDVINKIVPSLEGTPMEIPSKEPGRYKFVLGGLIFGLGWGVIGLCPGPIFALVGMGSIGALIVLAGALHGTWLYGVLRKYLPE